MIIIAISLLIAGLITFLFGFVAAMDAEGRGAGYVWCLPVGAIVALFALCWLICMFFRWWL